MDKCFYEKFEAKAPAGALDCTVTASNSTGYLEVRAVRSGIAYVVNNPGQRVLGSGEMVAIMPSESQAITQGVRGSPTIAFAAELVDLD